MTVAAGFAQDRMPGRVNTYTDEGTGTGFRKENLFIGGSLGLGFADNVFSIGVNPEIGYSLNRWLDAGVVVNFTYNSVSPDPQGIYNPDLSEKEFIYGGGLFARAYVLPFLFLTAQPEFNWTHDKQVYEAKCPGGDVCIRRACAELVAGYRIWAPDDRSGDLLVRHPVRRAGQYKFSV